MAGNGNDWEHLQAELNAAENLLNERRQNVEREEIRRRGQDRSWIARLITQLFAASVLLVLAAIVLLAAFADQGIWEQAAEKLVTLLSSVVLPVVTLVIGYYFGTEERPKGPGG